LKRGKIKAEIAVAKGKKEWDKRETIRRREADMEAKQAVRASKARHQ
jgi:SsrA-binding protein